MNHIRLLISMSFISLMSIFCTSSKVIYNEKTSDKERLKIIYQFNRDCRSFYMSLHIDKITFATFQIKDCPKRFGIDKRYGLDSNVNYTFRMVTDTTANQFKCLDYSFLPQYCNSTVAKSFIPINEKEKEIFKILKKTIQSGNYEVQLNDYDIDRFIGWVKIFY